MRLGFVLERAMAENIHPQQDAFVIRLASPQDRAQIDALLESGLLPGHVNYEAQRADRIRRSLG